MNAKVFGMIKNALRSICVLLLIISFSFEAFCLENGDLSAASAVLYCPGTGDVLFQKDAYQLRSMASTTKIMTALLALEQNTPDRIIEITDEMVNVEGTSAGLRAGDKITLEDIVYSMMLESGNDAANAAAIAISGSFSGFAALMNQRAKEIGMKNTSFVTPSGLDDTNHYTTCYDMALLAAEAMENKDFRRICSTSSYKVEYVDSDKTVTLYNHHKMLSSFEGCLGIKTGFTKKSGRCLVTAAERNGVMLIAVTLKAPDDWNDHAKMLEYGFTQVESVALDTDFSVFSVNVAGSDIKSLKVEGENASVPVFVSDSGKEISRKIYLEKFLYAPVEEGAAAGFAEYYIGDKMIKKVPLTVVGSAPVKEREKSFFEQLKDKITGLLFHRKLLVSYEIKGF